MQNSAVIHIQPLLGSRSLIAVHFFLSPLHFCPLQQEMQWKEHRPASQVSFSDAASCSSTGRISRCCHNISEMLSFIMSCWSKGWGSETAWGHMLAFTGFPRRKAQYEQQHCMAWMVSERELKKIPDGKRAVWRRAGGDNKVRASHGDFTLVAVFLINPTNPTPSKDNYSNKWIAYS